MVINLVNLEETNLLKFVQNCERKWDFRHVSN